MNWCATWVSTKFGSRRYPKSVPHAQGGVTLIDSIVVFGALTVDCIEFQPLTAGHVHIYGKMRSDSPPSLVHVYSLTSMVTAVTIESIGVTPPMWEHFWYNCSAHITMNKMTLKESKTICRGCLISLMHAHIQKLGFIFKENKHVNSFTVLSPYCTYIPQWTLGCILYARATRNILLEHLSKFYFKCGCWSIGQDCHELLNQWKPAILAFITSSVTI